MDQLWVDKYKPKNSEEILGNNKIIETIKISIYLKNSDI